MSDLWTVDPREALRAGEEFDLDSLDRASTFGFIGDKAAAETLTAERGKLLSELQERLFANGRAGGKRNVLVIIQGLDTAGKGGIVRYVMGMVDPQGVALRSFGVPTAEERSHHYLWRIKKALPKPGLIGVFDRSQYEDVLVVRVDNLVDQDVWEPRFAEINRWERTLVNGGTTVLKFALMPSYDEQARRLMERIDRPDKRWKYSTGDLGTRSKWDQFQEAYADVFRRTSTEHAPWYVLPADRKWYSRLAITEILTRALIEMELKWPRVRWSPEVQRRRLAKTMSPELYAESAGIVQKSIDASMDVSLEAAELRDAHADDATRESAIAAIESRRAELEADLATTLEDKQALLEEMAPDLAAATAATIPTSADAIAVDEKVKDRAAKKSKKKDDSKMSKKKKKSKK
ncbi:PPK2 family polyphosphate kinase [Kocuria salsicia]|uniref:PPK2 family polyphosphate kinase n=1 Tax=Kocuria salsicia TaxID=664639 RepID=UPI0016437E3C|nr:PPK2 family polyphosphate kinase [Kocuria salsicia]